MKKKSPGFHFTLTIDVDLEREQGVGQEPDVCDDDVDPGREQARQGPGIVEILTQNRVSNPANGRVGPGHQRHCDGDASRELRGIRQPRGVPVPVDLPSEGEDDVEERRGERGGADARGADEPRRLPLLLDLRGQSVRETQEAGHGCCSGDGHPGHADGGERGDPLELPDLRQRDHYQRGRRRGRNVGRCNPENAQGLCHCHCEDRRLEEDAQVDAQISQPPAPVPEGERAVVVEDARSWGQGAQQGKEAAAVDGRGAEEEQKKGGGEPAEAGEDRGQGEGPEAEHVPEEDEGGGRRGGAESSLAAAARRRGGVAAAAAAAVEQRISGIIDGV